MKRIGITSLACSALFAALLAGVAQATPAINGAVVTTRTFNDCPLSTLTTTNNYPGSITIKDVMDPDCAGFANLHSFSFSADGGATAAVFDNDASYHFGADITISGAGTGEGGLRVSPWWSQYVDGRFMANATTGEVACFGGRLPFYSFTGNYGLNYVKGTTIRFEITYQPHHLTGDAPATIQYRAIYNGNTYDSPVLSFDPGNPAECDHGMQGELNDARVGGYFQVRANTGADLQITWANITFDDGTIESTPEANAAFIQTRTFNDCPLSTLAVTNNYPALVQISDTMDPDCAGFANLHSWSFSDDGGTTAEVFDNDAHYHFGADFTLSGDGQGEGGLRVSPWWSQYVDGRFMANATTGEVACFGGRLPFYSFTGNYGLTYVKGTTIHLEITYRPNDLTSTNPATIQYRAVYNGTTYDSPVLAFDQANPAECNPHGLWGELNDARVGGYFQARANTGAQLVATWGDIRFDTCVDPVALKKAEIHPHDINLKSKAKYVDLEIEVANPLSARDIDPASLRVNGVPISSSHPDVHVDDHHLHVKLDRSAFAATLTPPSDVITIEGMIGNDCFLVYQTIKVKAPKIKAPHAAQVYQPGDVAQIQWDTPSDEPINTVSIVTSLDGGLTWTVEAANIPNTGSYTWHVPYTPSATTRVGVVTVDLTDDTGPVTGVEIAESEDFTINSTTGVGSQDVSFALRGVAPMPAKGSFSVSFSLPSAKAATLALYDIAGRKVYSREVGGMGAGVHSVSIGARENLRPGLYMVRLSQGANVQKGRALLIQ